MWRSSSASRLLFRSLLGTSVNPIRFGCAEHKTRPWTHLFFSASASPSSAPAPVPPPSFCTSPPPPPPAMGGAARPNSDRGRGLAGKGGAATAAEPDGVSLAEAKKLMRLVNVEWLKMKLGMEGEEVIEYAELLDACKVTGVARSREEAAAFVRVLDEAGVVLLFRDKVYLHPDKVVELMKKAVPLALTPENDPRREELKQLLKQKEGIDMLAHRQVQRVLWSGLGFFVVQIGLFFRLTFWDFSWDVMEPITFFTTTTGLLVGYAYFLFTSRDPTYQDLMKRLFLSRQRKLFQKQNFNVDRFVELQKRCRCPLDDAKRLGLDAFHKF